MTRLPAISMSSIMSVELHFEQEAGSYFNCKERASTLYGRLAEDEHASP